VICLTLDKTYDLGLAGSGITLFDAIRAVYGSVLPGPGGHQARHDGQPRPIRREDDDPGRLPCCAASASMQPGDANGAKEELLRKMFSLPKPEDQGGPEQRPCTRGRSSPAPLAGMRRGAAGAFVQQDGMTFKSRTSRE